MTNRGPLGSRIEELERELALAREGARRLQDQNDIARKALRLLGGFRGDALKALEQMDDIGNQPVTGVTPAD